ncbi:MAG: hypothetical protein M1336_04160 [Deltaproteobacteria bacterium]|jgi:hypothetical protein|nr:hypothetical protein [Deltaproteobacteria bacterium]
MDARTALRSAAGHAGYRLVLLIVLLGLGGLGAGFGPLAAAAAPPATEDDRSVSVQVDCVIATDTNEGVDAELAPIGSKLKALFSYSTYRLVQHSRQEARLGRTLPFSLPGGRVLNVRPSATEGNMVAMEVVLFEGTRPVMVTHLKLRDRGTLILGGPRYHQGMLLVSISVAASGHSPAAAAVVEPRPVAPAPAMPAGAKPVPAVTSSP